MKTFISLALVATALAMPKPQSSTPEGCSDSHDGGFTITVVDASQSAKREVEKRQQAGVLTLTLSGGVLKDQADRTGYIASNHQFQFDAPPQANALKTSGFSLCSNGSLALDGSAIWYQCLSGEFHNLYDSDWAEQCSPIYLISQKGTGGSPPATQNPDGQPAASTVLPSPPVSQISDGQPQAPTGVPPPPPVSQISDGQPQAPTGSPHPAPPVTQISDGQPQAPTAAPSPPAPPVTQISDGQPQAPTAVPPAPSAPPVTQISDGQPQAPTVAPPVPPPVTQISDGQPQAPVATANVTTPGNFSATATAPPEFTGAAATPIYGVGALAAGLMGLFAML